MQYSRTYPYNIPLQHLIFSPYFTPGHVDRAQLLHASGRPREALVELLILAGAHRTEPTLYLDNSTLCCIALYCASYHTVLTVSFCTAPHCTVLYCTVLYCILLISQLLLLALLHLHTRHFYYSKVHHLILTTTQPNLLCRIYPIHTHAMQRKFLRYLPGFCPPCP